MMEKQIVIFGAGKLGKTAFHYYREQGKILCFIDNNAKVRGNTIENIPVYSPEILFSYHPDCIKIVIAVREKTEEVQKQLYTEYGIRETISFQIDEVPLSFPDSEEFTGIKPKIIVCFSGGLGNQMFQYTLARCFMKLNHPVSADVSSYSLWSTARFELPLVFPAVQIETCTWKEKMYYEKVAGLRYKELKVYSEEHFQTDMEVLRRQQGVVEGYWQSRKYVEMVRDDLRRDFRFQRKNDHGLQKMIRDVKNCYAVSVHIRRTDYLQLSSLYEGICTDEYYENAIEYMTRRTADAVLYFFSDDIQWVSEKYKKLKNAVFVKKEMFDDYENWYDMYLMSCCRHNIIANSSFSWWGAWLNGSPDKRVIAPRKWIAGKEISDICPESWIRM